MRIRQKLLAGFLFISLLTIGVSFGVSFLVQDKIVAIFQEVGGKILPGDIALSRMTTELYHTVVLLDKYEANPDDHIRREIEITLSALDAHKTTHDLFHRDDELKAQIEQLIQEFSRSVAQYVLLLQKGEGKENGLAVRQKIDSLLEQFVDSINPNIEEGFEISYQKISDVQKMNLQFRQTLVIGSGIILLLALLLSLFIADLFSRPLRALRDAAQHIGAGQLDLTLPVTSRDEIGDLAQAFNDMSKSLAVMQAEEARLQQILRRSQKMDALGKLTGGIAHDFNNMLGVILGYSDLLLHRVSNDPKLENYAKQIQSAGERAKILTTKLLAFSRKETISAEPIDTNQVLLDGRHMIEKTLTARIELVLELSENLWPVWQDKASLEDAILNMSINAMHAIAESGKLTLATSNVHLDTADLLHMNIGVGDYVLLTITDTGIGMDQNTQQRVFEPFYSTKGEQGTGLGMSQVYGFVQQSSGGIYIDSELGHGTQISIYLPRYSESPVSETGQKTEVLENELFGQETILVVDDELALCDLTEEILTTHGYRVLCAENGERALEILKTESVDLLFSDVIMPGMDGYQLVKKVGENYPQIKIQMASGFSDEQHIDRNEELHQQRLQKPFASKLLLQRVRKLLDEKEICSEVEQLHPVKWSAKISTGIDQVDDDHKILLLLLNRCINAVARNVHSDEIGAILEDLLVYAGYHFRREEVIMSACNYPYLGDHKLKHEQLADQVNQQIKEFSGGDLSVESLLKFLQNWLINHIIASDRDIIPYCKGKESIVERALVEAGLSHSSNDQNQFSL